MPSIPEGANLTDSDKKKIDKLKAKGADKSSLSTVRMALLRGHTYRQAMAILKKKRKTKEGVVHKKSTKPAEETVEVVYEE